MSRTGVDRTRTAERDIAFGQIQLVQGASQPITPENVQVVYSLNEDNSELLGLSSFSLPGQLSYRIRVEASVE